MHDITFLYIERPRCLRLLHTVAVVRFTQLNAPLDLSRLGKFGLLVFFAKVPSQPTRSCMLSSVPAETIHISAKRIHRIYKLLMMYSKNLYSKSLYGTNSPLAEDTMVKFTDIAPFLAEFRRL